MDNTRVIKITKAPHNWKEISTYVYIGRGSVYGNPYEIDKDGTRKEVIEKYRILLEKKIREDDFLKHLRWLKGRVLVCHCKPLACHGDVLAEYADRINDD